MGSNDRLFSLKWNSYFKHLTGAFDSLRVDEDLVDVTLSCEGRKIRAHKLLLSACSSYFKELFTENPCQHPVIIFKDVKFSDLEAIVTFIYQGEVNVMQDHLESFISIAESLMIQGLATQSQSDEQLPPQDMTNTTNNFGSTFDTQPLMKVASNTAAATSSKTEKVLKRTTPSSSPITKRQKCTNSDVNSMEGVNYNNDCNSRRDVLQNNIKTEPLDYEVQSSYSNDSAHVSNEEMTNINSVVKQEEPDSWDDFCTNEQTNSNPSMSLSNFEQLLKKSELTGPIDESLQSVRGNSFSTNSEKEFSCSICGQKYKYQTSLLAHKKMHSGETKCHICAKVLSTKHILLEHIRMIHGIH